MVKVADDLKLVQEIAKRVSEPPSQFVQKEENRPIGVAPKATDVPIIHLRRLFEPDGEEALQLNDALRTWGLFQVVSDDISASFLDEIHCVSKKFFDLPKEEKLKFKTPRDDGEFTLEGYGSDVVQTEDQIRDWNDRVLLLVHPENERKLELWPDNPSSFRSLLHEFSSKSTKIVKDVLRAIAKLLELEDDYFTNQYGEDFISYARFNYYAGFPKCDAVMGMKAHCDDSTLTLLLLDKDVEGLQVLKNGEWLSIPAVTNALLVNLGDQMEIMSNGIFKGPMHRVIANSQERLSVGMFYSVNYDQFIGPADSLIDESRPKLYKKVFLRDYLQSLHDAFLQGKRGIDLAKV